MKTRFLLLLIVLFAFSLVSCRTGYDMDQIPAPKSGQANVFGRISSAQFGYTEGIIVRLAEIYRNEEGEGVYALDTASSPYTTTDENGYFLFENVKAMEYVLVVGDPMTKYEIIVDEEGVAKVWEFPADETTDVGEISIDF